MKVHTPLERVAPKAASLKGRHRKYSTFTIPKRGGGTRTISAPSPELKEAQRDLNQWLEPMARRETTHGFTKGRGVASGVKAAIRKTVWNHKDNLWVLTIDLKDAFPTVKVGTVRRIFSQWLNHQEARRAAYIATWDGKLPQGSPVSPTLLNLALAGLDDKLQRMAREHNGIYLRYADDIVLIMEGEPDELWGTTLHHIEGEGWTPHPTKRRIARLSNGRGFEVFGNRIHFKDGKATSQPRKATRRAARALGAARKLKASDPESYEAKRRGYWAYCYSTVLKGTISRIYGAIETIQPDHEKREALLAILGRPKMKTPKDVRALLIRGQVRHSSSG